MYRICSRSALGAKIGIFENRSKRGEGVREEGVLTIGING